MCQCRFLIHTSLNFGYLQTTSVARSGNWFIALLWDILPVAVEIIRKILLTEIILLFPSLLTRVCASMYWCACVCYCMLLKSAYMQTRSLTNSIPAQLYQYQSIVNVLRCLRLGLHQKYVLPSTHAHNTTQTFAHQLT